MIRIIFDQGTLEAGGHILHVHKNIRDRVTPVDNHSGFELGVMAVDVKGYDKDHEFDISLSSNLSLDCIVLKLDKTGEVSVERMSEQAFMSRKHMQTE